MLQFSKIINRYFTYFNTILVLHIKNILISVYIRIVEEISSKCFFKCNLEKIKFLRWEWIFAAAEDETEPTDDWRKHESIVTQEPCGRRHVCVFATPYFVVPVTGLPAVPCSSFKSWRIVSPESKTCSLRCRRGMDAHFLALMHFKNSLDALTTSG